LLIATEAPFPKPICVSMYSAYSSTAVSVEIVKNDTVASLRKKVILKRVNAVSFPEVGKFAHFEL